MNKQPNLQQKKRKKLFSKLIVQKEVLANYPGASNTEVLPP